MLGNLIMPHKSTFYTPFLMPFTQFKKKLKYNYTSYTTVNSLETSYGISSTIKLDAGQNKTYKVNLSSTSERACIYNGIKFTALLTIDNTQYTYTGITYNSCIHIDLNELSNQNNFFLDTTKFHTGINEYIDILIVSETLLYISYSSHKEIIINSVVYNWGNNIETKSMKELIPYIQTTDKISYSPFSKDMGYSPNLLITKYAEILIGNNGLYKILPNGDYVYIQEIKNKGYNSRSIISDLHFYKESDTDYYSVYTQDYNTFTKINGAEIVKPTYLTATPDKAIIYSINNGYLLYKKANEEFKYIKLPIDYPEQGSRIFLHIDSKFYIYTGTSVLISDDLTSWSIHDCVISLTTTIANYYYINNTIVHIKDTTISYTTDLINWKTCTSPYTTDLLTCVVTNNYITFLHKQSYSTVTYATTTDFNTFTTGSLSTGVNSYYTKLYINSSAIIENLFAVNFYAVSSTAASTYNGRVHYTTDGITWNVYADISSAKNGVYIHNVGEQLMLCNSTTNRYSYDAYFMDTDGTISETSVIQNTPHKDLSCDFQTIQEIRGIYFVGVYNRGQYSTAPDTNMGIAYSTDKGKTWDIFLIDCKFKPKGYSSSSIMSDSTYGVFYTHGITYFICSINSDTVDNARASMILYYYYDFPNFNICYNSTIAPFDTAPLCFKVYNNTTPICFQNNYGTSMVTRINNVLDNNVQTIIGGY